MPFSNPFLRPSSRSRSRSMILDQNPDLPNQTGVLDLNRPESWFSLASMSEKNRILVYLASVARETRILVCLASVAQQTRSLVQLASVSRQTRSLVQLASSFNYHDIHSAIFIINSQCKYRANINFCF